MFIEGFFFPFLHYKNNLKNIYIKHEDGGTGMDGYAM